MSNDKGSVNKFHIIENHAKYNLLWKYIHDVFCMIYFKEKRNRLNHRIESYEILVFVGQEWLIQLICFQN